MTSTGTDRRSRHTCRQDTSTEARSFHFRSAEDHSASSQSSFVHDDRLLQTYATHDDLLAAAVVAAVVAIQSATYSASYLADDCRLVADAPSDDYAPQRARHASLPGPTAPLVIELLQLPVPGYGTVYHHISEMPLNTVQSVPAVTKDILVWVVGPRCSANYFNCAIQK